MKSYKRASIHFTDSSDSNNDVTNMEQNIYSVLNAAREAAGHIGQCPKKPVPADNEVKVNFRKSIIKRAVHPVIVSSTPFHSKTRNGNSFENMSAISEIGDQNDPSQANVLGVIAEAHGCDEKHEQKKRTVNKEKSKLVEDHSRNESIGKRNNDSIKINNLKDMSLRITEHEIKDKKNLCSTTLDQCNNKSLEKIQTNKENSEIFKQQIQTGKVHDHFDTEDNILVNGHLEAMHNDESLAGIKITSKQEKNDTKDHKHTQTLNQSHEAQATSEVENSDAACYSRKEEPILQPRVVLEENRVNEENNHSQSLKVQSKIQQSVYLVESSDLELHTAELKTKTKQDKRKNDEEHYYSSPLKKNRIIEKEKNRSISHSRKVCDSISEDSEGDSGSNLEPDTEEEETLMKAEKPKFANKNGYYSCAYSGRVMKGKKILDDQEKLKSLKRKEYFSDVEERVLNEEQGMKAKKISHKPARSKSLKRNEYSFNEEDSDVNEGQKIRDKKVSKKPKRLKKDNRKDYSFDLEETELNREHIVRGKKILQKPEKSKNFKRKEYYSSEEHLQLIEEQKVREKKLWSKPFRRKEYSSDEEESDVNEEHKKRERLKSLKRIVYYSTEDDSEFNEVFETKSRNTLKRRDRSKSLKRNISHSSEDRRESNNVYKMKLRKTVQKRQRSKSKYALEELSDDSDAYEEMKAARPIRKVLYVKQDDCIVSDLRKEKLKLGRGRSVSQKKFKYVEQDDCIVSDLRKDKLKSERGRSVSQKKFKYGESSRYPRMMKEQRQIIEVYPDESDIDRRCIRKSEFKRGPSRYKPKYSNRVTNHKQYVVIDDSSYTQSPSIIDPGPSKIYGRLSRRDSYILDQKNNRKIGRPIFKNNNNIQDSSDVNFTTPVNPKIIHPQQGMTTIIRGIVQEQLAKHNVAKVQPITDPNMTDSGHPVLTYANNGILNENEDEKKETSTKEVHFPNKSTEISRKNMRDFNKDNSGSLVLTNEPEEVPNESETQKSRSTFITSDNSCSLINFRDYLNKINIAKHGDFADFESNNNLRQVRKLARQPYTNISSVCGLGTKRLQKKAKKGLVDIIGYLARNTKLTNVGVQTSLQGITDVEVTQENDLQVPQSSKKGKRGRKELASDLIFEVEENNVRMPRDESTDSPERHVFVNQKRVSAKTRRRTEVTPVKTQRKNSIQRGKGSDAVFDALREDNSQIPRGEDMEITQENNIKVPHSSRKVKTNRKEQESALISEVEENNVQIPRDESSDFSLCHIPVNPKPVSVKTLRRTEVTPLKTQKKNSMQRGGGSNAVFDALREDNIQIPTGEDIELTQENNIQVPCSSRKDKTNRKELTSDLISEVEENDAQMLRDVNPKHVPEKTRRRAEITPLKTQRKNSIQTEDGSDSVFDALREAIIQTHTGEDSPFQSQYLTLSPLKSPRISETSNRKLRIRRNKKDNRIEKKPQDENIQIPVNEDVIFAKPESVKKGKKQPRTKKNTRIDRELVISDSETNSAKIVILQNVTIQKPKTKRGSSTEQRNNRAKTTRTECANDQADSLIIRRSAREKKPVNPCWWGSIIAASNSQSAPKKSTKSKEIPSTSTTSMEETVTSTKKKGKSSPNKKVRKSLSISPTSIKEKVTSTKKKRKSRLTMRVGKNSSKQKKNKKMLSIEMNKERTDMNGEHEKNNVNGLSNDIEINSEAFCITEMNNLIAMSERTTEIYNSHQGTSRDDDGGCIGTINGAQTNIRIVEQDLMSFAAKFADLGKVTTECYPVGRHCIGFLGLAPREKKHTVNNEFDVVYQKMEGTISLALGGVLYRILPDFVRIPKGQPSEIENMGIERALLLYILLES